MQNNIDVAMKSEIGHSKCPEMGGGGANVKSLHMSRKLKQMSNLSNMAPKDMHPISPNSGARIIAHTTVPSSLKAYYF
jgi:hypothetical protein